MELKRTMGIGVLALLISLGADNIVKKWAHDLLDTLAWYSFSISHGYYASNLFQALSNNIDTWEVQAFSSTKKWYIINFRASFITFMDGASDQWDTLKRFLDTIGSLEMLPDYGDDFNKFVIECFRNHKDDELAKVFSMMNPRFFDDIKIFEKISSFISLRSSDDMPKSITAFIKLNRKNISENTRYLWHAFMMSKPYLDLQEKVFELWKKLEFDNSRDYAMALWWTTNNSKVQEEVLLMWKWVSSHIDELTWEKRYVVDGNDHIMFSDIVDFSFAMHWIRGQKVFLTFRWMADVLRFVWLNTPTFGSDTKENAYLPQTLAELLRIDVDDVHNNEQLLDSYYKTLEQLLRIQDNRKIAKAYANLLILEVRDLRQKKDPSNILKNLSDNEKEQAIHVAIRINDTIKAMNHSKENIDRYWKVFDEDFDLSRQKELSAEDLNDMNTASWVDYTEIEMWSEFMESINKSRKTVANVNGNLFKESLNWKPIPNRQIYITHANFLSLAKWDIDHQKIVMDRFWDIQYDTAWPFIQAMKSLNDIELKKRLSSMMSDVLINQHNPEIEKMISELDNTKLSSL